jgi:hypothetical protein
MQSSKLTVTYAVTQGWHYYLHTVVDYALQLLRQPQQAGARLPGNILQHCC